MGEGIFQNIAISPSNIILGFILGCIFCMVLGIALKREFFYRMFRKLEHIIMLISAIVLGITMIFDGVLGIRSVGTTYLSIFSSIIFSWLLTRWSAKKEYEEQEIDLAKISYRHIQQTEASVITLIKEIREFLSHDSESKTSATVNIDPKEELRNILSTLEHLKGSIGANKQDWLDKLPEGHEKEKIPKIDDEQLQRLEKLRDTSNNNQEIA